MQRLKASLPFKKSYIKKEYIEINQIDLLRLIKYLHSIQYIFCTVSVINVPSQRIFSYNTKKIFGK